MEGARVSTILFHPDGRIEPQYEVQGDSVSADLVRQGANGPFVRLAFNTEDISFHVWMGLDLSQPINTFARQAIDGLAALHVMCFGPVLFTDLDEDIVRELSRG